MSMKRRDALKAGAAVAAVGAGLDLQAQEMRQLIERTNAQTEKLESAEPFIKIDGGGLDPRLQKFLYEALAKIQIQASHDYMEFLIGIEPDRPPFTPPAGWPQPIVSRMTHRRGAVVALPPVPLP